MRLNGQVGRCRLLIFLLTGTFVSASFAAWCCQGAAADDPARVVRRVAEAGTDGWTAAAPRDEIRPEFAFDPKGGRDGAGCLVIRADAREGLDGYWTKTFPIAGSQHYLFGVKYQATNVAVPRRSIVVKIHWQDAK